MDSDETISKKRQLEKISCGYLLNLLGGENLYRLLEKDENGKPYIQGSTWSVSFSHSRNMIACIIDKSGSDVGIDIEEMRERIVELSSKFVSEKDITLETGMKHCHLVWGAKEVLYKIYSKKELEFLEHLSVNLKDENKGYIQKGAYISSHSINYAELKNFMLVWSE